MCGSDLYSEYGSRKLLNTDPIQIRIHNTDFPTDVGQVVQQHKYKPLCSELFGKKL